MRERHSTLQLEVVSPLRDRLPGSLWNRVKWRRKENAWSCPCQNVAQNRPPCTEVPIGSTYGRMKRQGVSDGEFVLLPAEVALLK